MRLSTPTRLFALSAIASSALLLSACSTPSAVSPVTPSTPSASAPNHAQLLGQYHWALQSATSAQGQRIDAFFPTKDKPMTLDFEAGRVSIGGGCNRSSASYLLDGNKLVVGQSASTMMACAPALMAADKSMANALAQPASWNLQPGQPSTLTLVTATQDKLVFTGTPTMESQFGQPTRIFLEVAPQKVSCNHPLMPQAQCLQVREIQFNEQGLRVGEPGPWQVFQGNIQGFTHEPGYRSVLRVKRYTRSNPPADASRYVHVLDLQVQSERVAK